MIPPCTTTVVMLPMLVYGIVYVYAGYRAQKEVVARPSGFLWQFRRESYSEQGWKWHIRTRWIFAAFLPTALVLVQIARLVCPDWGL